MKKTQCDITTLTGRSLSLKIRRRAAKEKRVSLNQSDDGGGATTTAKAGVWGIELPRFPWSLKSQTFIIIVVVVVVEKEVKAVYSTPDSASCDSSFTSHLFIYLSTMWINNASASPLFSFCCCSFDI